jgi:Holliday junction resolvase RusA-like endonuclease
MRISVDPVAKPRMTRRDKWAVRPSVARYRAYADALRAEHSRELQGTVSLVFHIPMPKSWSRSKRDAMCGEPHRSKPDVDNLIKGVLDALLPDDRVVWRVTAEKRWADEGSVEVRS